MKDKNLAGILGLFFGGLGVHRFYLGQIGLGILYLFFFYITWFIGIIDALVFFSMDQDEFDRKYNKDMFREREYDRYDRYRDRDRYDRDRRREERDERRYDRYQRRDQDRDERMAEQQRRQEAGGYRRPPVKPRNPYRESGIEKFKDYDYEGAVADFEKALEVDAKDVATHFNLACTYSLMERKDKSFYHLDRAVALGFDDLSRIKNHDALAFLRIQPEYEQFERNGFRLAPQLEAPKEDLLSTRPTVAPVSTDLLEQLQRLGELREKGLLTEEEFVIQKKKLLG